MGSRELVFSASKKDFRVDTFASGGPGGQHQNKTRSGVRITHLATGLVAECREHREQPKNKRTAWRRLCDLLVQHVRDRDARVKTISNETIRTYHEPDNRVKDHVSREVRTYRQVILDGDESGLIDARRKAVVDQQ